ncbi:MAG TPA: 4-alpha-glucanotransferase [Candidatus Limnocylindria bacterium]|jgi:4-alpha-glucanotransferase|nr:4-alpha-glucanotransferase [Candidatus Limnocylindria bacterium]
MNLSPEKKIAGVLAPLFALRGKDDLGIGDLAALREFIDWVAEIGFKLVQLLPINETGADNSPYNAISAVAIEPTTLHLAPNSPQDLRREDFDGEIADVDLNSLRLGAVKYRAVKKLKRRLLEKAFANFSAHADQQRQSEFRAFFEQQSAWLRDYAFFRVLMEANDDSAAWNRWPQQHQTMERARSWLHDLPHDRQAALTSRQEFFCYVQWIAHQQWRAIKSYAEERGVALMGDIPFGVSYCSADVFARPDEFMLDWFGGAPPEPYFKDDPFTQKWGQNWGIPLYRWNKMCANNFQWWRERVRAIRRVFHLCRIDHILGFYRIYAFPWRPRKNKEFFPLDWNQMLERTAGRAPHFIPRDDETADNRQANKLEGEEYLRVILEEAGTTRVIGEDLGLVPDYVRPNLHSLGIAGFKIPQWEGHDGMIIPGDRYERLSVASYATHDHEPIRALWNEAFEHPASDAGEQARATLEKIAVFAGLNPKIDALDFEKDFYPAVMDALFRCNSWIAMVMITDLLARKYRFNVPGTKANLNWTRRMQRSIAQLSSSRKERKRMQLINELLVKTGRV